MRSCTSVFTSGLIFRDSAADHGACGVGGTPGNVEGGFPVMMVATPRWLFARMAVSRL